NFMLKAQFFHGGHNLVRCCELPLLKTLPQFGIADCIRNRRAYKAIALQCLIQKVRVKELLYADFQILMRETTLDRTPALQFPRIASGFSSRREFHLSVQTLTGNDHMNMKVKTGLHLPYLRCTLPDFLV